MKTKFKFYRLTEGTIKSREHLVPGYVPEPEDTQYYLSFNGTTSGISVGSDASLDDLHSADFTAEAWVYFDTPIETGAPIIGSSSFAGAGWTLFLLTDTTRPVARINLDGSDAGVTAADPISETTWTHIAMVYDSATKTVTLYIGGTLAGTHTGSGNIIVDANFNKGIGTFQPSGTSLAGRIAWIRISDNKRYTSGFTPAAKDAPPAVDGNTIEQWNFNDGSGSTLTAEVSSNNNGTITDGSWGTL